MENYINNAIVQEDGEKNTEPNAEINKTIDNATEETDRAIERSEAVLQNDRAIGSDGAASQDAAPLSSDDKDSSPADAISGDGTLAEATKPQGEERPAIDIAEAMRKIMNFTSSVGAHQEEDRDGNRDHIDEEGVNTENTSLSHSDAEEIVSDESVPSNVINEENKEFKNIEEPSDDVPNEVSYEISEGEDINTEGGDDEQDIDDDEDILEDEFGSIPDSFFDEDFSYDDDNSSISALLYDDDDDNAESDFEKSDNVSFAKLKEEMQRIKNEAIELREIIEDEDNEDVIASGEKAIEEAATETGEDAAEIIEATEDATEAEEAANESEDVSPQAEAPITPEKKSYIRDIDRKEIKEEEQSEERSEHIITIDRTRIKDRSVPDGRPIDSVFEAAELFTFAFLIIMMLLCFMFRNTTVSGESMMPTFNDGDRLIISNLFYEPKRGDIVVFDDRTNTAYDDIPIIKRIIGLEGDVVKIEGGIIMVKEAGSDEFTVVDYVYDMDIPYRDMDEVTVGKGEMFVMGDNVNNSLDSTDRNENDPTKNVGNVKVDSILGKVLFRFYVVETIFSEETQEWVIRGRIVFDTSFTKNKP